MKYSRSIILPSVGMLGLAVFILIAYMHDSVFLDKILISSIIISVVYISKVLESAYQKNHASKKLSERRIAK